MNKTTIITSGAEMGGKKVSNLFVPYFMAFKRACKEIVFEDFPFKELAFLFRVCGEIKNYEGSGLDAYELNKKDDFLAIDIVITKKIREDLISYFEDLPIETNKYLIKMVKEKKIKSYNEENLLIAIEKIVANFKQEMKNKPTSQRNR